MPASRTSAKTARNGKSSRPRAHEAVLTAIQKAGIETVSAEVAMPPILLVKLAGREASSMLKLSEALRRAGRRAGCLRPTSTIDEKEMEALAE